MLRKWCHLRPWHMLVGIAAGLITIAAAANSITGWPSCSFLTMWTHQLEVVQPTEDFKIESIQTMGGITLNPPDRFSYKFDIPLDAKGTTTLGRTSHVWMLLKDQFGGYYLQFPEVEIRGNGQWVSHDIRPLAGIKQILWISVDKAGHSFLNQKASAGEWGKFTTLPDSAHELACVQMR